LGIQPIFARSPQAKGRIERLWGTFQDRLVSELRLAGARTISKVLSVSKIIVNQLVTLCEELPSDQYSASLDLLMNNSIGTHMRHIIEFYDILKDSCEGSRILSYDKREHCSKTETEIDAESMQKVELIISQMNPHVQSKLPKERKFYKGAGCEYCGGIGYKGRLGIYETIDMQPEIKQLMQEPY